MPGEHPGQIEHGRGGQAEVEGGDEESQGALDHQALPPGAGEEPGAHSGKTWGLAIFITW